MGEHAAHDARSKLTLRPLTSKYSKMEGQDWATVTIRGVKPTIRTGLGGPAKPPVKNVTPEAAPARRLEQQETPQKPK